MKRFNFLRTPATQPAATPTEAAEPNSPPSSVSVSTVQPDAGPARSRRWTQTGLLVAVVLLAVAGLILLGTYFFLSRQTVADSGWVSPLAGVQADAVAPDLAVLTLAGEPDDRIIRASLDAGERETAYATLAYSVLLPDNVRSGQWLILAAADQAANPDRAASSYLAALDLAALGPTLGDPARADVSLLAARGFDALEKRWLAPLLVAQAGNVARYSPTLLPAQRRDVLNQVAAAHDRLDQPDAARAVRDNIGAYSAGPGLVIDKPEPLLPTLRGAVTLPPEVIAALSARQQAAAAFAARWLNAGPSDREALAQSLGEALVAEDAARASFYGSATELSEADSLALLHDRINWLTIKLRAGRGGYGTSLVPDWESQTNALVGELATAYTDLVNGYGRLLDTLDPVEATHARVELLRQAVLWVRLGLFPDQGAEDALSRQLGEASKDLWSRQGGVGLTIVNQIERGLRLYLLAGSDAREFGS
jgi:hypothetical protein